MPPTVRYCFLISLSRPATGRTPCSLGHHTDDPANHSLCVLRMYGKAVGKGDQERGWVQSILSCGSTGVLHWNADSCRAPTLYQRSALGAFGLVPCVLSSLHPRRHDQGCVPKTPLGQSLTLLTLPPTLTHSLPDNTRRRIFLLGSGPGHPSLLTQATHIVLTQLTDLMIFNNIVPEVSLHSFLVNSLSKYE
ncbi:hypothetical protein DFP72DRAFT_337695 [Ephemerocybe angulata]|uniref:Uncharacterized protein n=1 Tax=Ephemerocybe angulata TaxID=980116 RepID=A0A8H6IGX5_9AGAR|nr:hypothetical protein DFP72DRAFT_337695 [Tulosesus angulatus]